MKQQNNHSFNQLFENSIKENWDKNALTDFNGATLQYHDVARKIEKIHIIFEKADIKKGDKIALCGRNSSMWGVVFLAVETYGAVSVPVQNEFTPEQIYNIVNHSDAKLLFAGDVVLPTLDFERMPALQGMFLIPDISLPFSRSENLTYAREHLNELYGDKFPKYFRKEHVSYYHDEPDELAMINYTSGTTGFSKGVMIPYRALWNNADWALNAIGTKLKKNSKVLEILPMGHMYGMVCEFFLQFLLGNHIHFLTRLPSPSVIQKAFQDIHPNIVVSVPLIIERIIRKNVLPVANSAKMKLLMKLPGINTKVKQQLYDMVNELMGGQPYEILTGGASFSKEVEDFLLSIGYPTTAGYGTTETAPLITYSDYNVFRPGSCGTAVQNMEVKILNPNPENGSGELLARGMNVMLGYYKNDEATKAVLDEEGWFHTGDLARIDESGHCYILGRIKNMLLGSNGQNVYPEEVEDKLNSMVLVDESLMLQKGNKFYCLVYPDKEEAAKMGLTDEDLRNVMEENRKQLNNQLPSFCRIAEIRLYDKEFEKTPKRSIKRYLYKDAIDA